MIKLPTADPVLAAEFREIQLQVLAARRAIYLAKIAVESDPGNPSLEQELAAAYSHYGAIKTSCQRRRQVLRFKSLRVQSRVEKARLEKIKASAQRTYVERRLLQMRNREVADDEKRAKKRDDKIRKQLKRELTTALRVAKGYRTNLQRAENIVHGLRERIASREKRQFHDATTNDGKADHETESNR